MIFTSGRPTVTSFSYIMLWRSTRCFLWSLDVWHRSTSAKRVSSSCFRSTKTNSKTEIRFPAQRKAKTAFPELDNAPTQLLHSFTLRSLSHNLCTPQYTFHHSSIIAEPKFSTLPSSRSFAYCLGVRYSNFFLLLVLPRIQFLFRLRSTMQSHASLPVPRELSSTL